MPRAFVFLFVSVARSETVFVWACIVVYTGHAISWPELETCNCHALFMFCWQQIKTVFVGLLYSAIVPTGLLVTSVAMLTLYWVDKYSLLRQWKRPPVSIGFNGVLYETYGSKRKNIKVLHGTVAQSSREKICQNNRGLDNGRWQSTKIGWDARQTDFLSCKTALDDDNKQPITEVEVQLWIWGETVSAATFA